MLVEFVDFLSPTFKMYSLIKGGEDYFFAKKIFDLPAKNLIPKKR